MKEFKECNELIADFMGAVFMPEHNCYDWENAEHNPFLGRYMGTDKLKYNTDWNWLMDVVNKIENLELNTIPAVQQCAIGSVMASFDINRAHTIISAHETIANVRYGNNKLLSTYYAIVEFIKWYNENK